MAAESGLEAAAVEAPAPPRLPYAPSSGEEAAHAVTADEDVSADVRRLLDRLFDEPWTFEFFQAVHLLERLQPDRQRIGGFGDPRQEAVRLTSSTSVAFPASEIQGIDLRDGQPRMAVNFLGLTGPQGVLPLTYSLYVAERARAGDNAI